METYPAFLLERVIKMPGVFDGAPNADKIQPIMVISTNPTNSVVASPDGRIFINVERLIENMAIELLTKTMVAKIANDDTTLERLEVERQVLASILQQSKFIAERAMEEKLEREGVDLTLPE